MSKFRLHDLGITIGSLPAGSLNAITDVPGVLVGHLTLIEDQPHVVRTGITVIVPREGDIGKDYAFAGFHRFNGCGEMTGIHWLEEAGLLSSAIALTNTLQVGMVRDALSEYSWRYSQHGPYFLPVVAETYDGWLNDLSVSSLTHQHVFDVMQNARPGPVTEGNVGGGTGMICYDFKGGIGTSSRLAETKSGSFIVGALVQANHGNRPQLTIAGIPIGRLIDNNKVPSAWDQPAQFSSIIVILATDAPLLPMQCRRLAQRAATGLARTGGTGHNTSGDLFLAFATGNHVPARSEGRIHLEGMLPNDQMDSLIDAAAEAVEESILNALTAADTMTGQQGRTAYALPVDELQRLMEKNSPRRKPMSTKILDFRQIVELQPAHSLWRRYNPAQAPLRFSATSPQEAELWQNSVRQALIQQIGFQGLQEVPFDPQLIEEVDKGDYVRQKILLHTGPELLMPVYLLIPKAASGPLPTVIAYHGHGYGVKDIVGLHKDGRERNKPAGYHKDFGVELVRRGFLVAAPEISCFGERQTDFTYIDLGLGQEVPASTCAHTAVLAFHLGGSVIGLRVQDSLRLVDYLHTRPEVNAGAIGAMGISGGGMATFFSTCIDPRIRACVVSGYFCTFQDSILAMHHCLCNFVPGLARFGEMYDLAGLIAPRPMLVESADHDSYFPRFAVEKSVAKARQAYQIFQAGDQLETDYFAGGHQISGARAYDFLKEKLGH